jgi:hypothetical protein
MPLSEQEQRLLDEMERNLYQNDADFVATVGAGRGRTNYRGIVLGAILGVAGVATLLAGVGSHLPVIGVLGFVIMFVGVIVALTPSRTPRGLSGKAPTEGSAAQARRSGGFMESLNERWERRQEGRDS